MLEWEAGLCYLPGSQGSQSVDFGEPPPIPACLSSALWIALDSSSLLTHSTICVFSPEDWFWLLPVASSLPLALESWKLRKIIFLVWARGGGGLFDSSHELCLVGLFHSRKQVLLVCHLESSAPVPRGWLNGNLPLVVGRKVTEKEPPALMRSGVRSS